MGRNQNLELVRIFAAFGIVLFHSQAPGAAVGYGGLIAFVILSAMFARPASPEALAKGIMLPWLFWYLAYGAVNLILRGYFASPDLTLAGKVLYGTGVHLWYLPFIFVVCLIVGRIRGLAAEWIAALMVLLLLLVAPWWREFTFSGEPPIPQYLHVMPAVLIGLAFRSNYAALAALVALAAALVWQVPGMSISYAIGGLAVFLALLIKEMKWNVQPIADCMFGVYLLHPLALTVTNYTIGRFSVLGAVVAFLLALGFTYVARLSCEPTRIVLR